MPLLFLRVPLYLIHFLSKYPSIQLMILCIIFLIFNFSFSKPLLLPKHSNIFIRIRKAPPIVFLFPRVVFHALGLIISVSFIIIYIFFYPPRFPFRL